MYCSLFRHIFLILFVATLAVSHSAARANSAENRPPNVIVFLVDDMSWTDPACYGNEFHETPNIDRLAKQGMKFTDAYAACPVCSPTRASIMTGRYPATLNLTDFIPGHLRPWAKLLVPKMHNQLPLEEVSLAESVKPAGYVTGSFGKWHLGGRQHFPDKQGFDEFVVTGGGNHFAPKFRTTANPPFPPKDGEYMADYLTRRAMAFIDEHREKPFLLYLPHYAVHIPLHAEQKLIAKYRKKNRSPAISVKITSPQRIRQISKDLQAVMRSAGQPTGGGGGGTATSMHIHMNFSADTDIDKVLKAVSKYCAEKLPKEATVADLRVTAVHNPVYAAMVEHIDRSLGRIMRTLDELKLADNTVLIFFSDNGGLYKRFDDKGPAVMSNHPLRDEKGSLYEGGIREPCIIRWPGVVKAGSESRVPISSVDLWPTIADIAGTSAKFEHTIDGVSLLPVLKGTGSLKDRALYWHYPHYHHTSPAGAIRRGDYKLIEYFEDGRLELYNLAKDLGETQNLADSMPEKTKQLHAKLKAWRKKVGARMPRKNPYYDPKRADEWRPRRRFKRKPKDKNR